MIARIAAIAVALATFAFPRTASADAALPGDEASVVTVNRHLANLVAAPFPQRRDPMVAPALSTMPHLSPQAGPSWLLSPMVLDIASRYTKAEKLLHFQSHGLDANFWGAFNGGHSVKVRYVIQF